MPLLTEPNAATALGLTERQLRLLRRLGGGPTHLRVSTPEGTVIRYDTDDLATWNRGSMANSATTPTDTCADQQRRH